jgi:hypothetical protein
MSGQHDQKRDIQGEKKRRPYQTPRLTVYGAVRDLTAAGTGNTGEQIRNGIYYGPRRP